MEPEPDVFGFFGRAAQSALSARCHCLLAVTALESTETRSNACVPPRSPEVPYGASVFSGEYEVVRLLTIRTAHEHTADVFGHCNHSLVTVLRFTEVDYSSKEIQLTHS
jgi:hypothetical protein